MAVTEKIEIMNFDQEGYLEDGAALYETGQKMAALADKVHEKGYDAVFLMGVGGTWDEMMQLEYLMNKFGDKDLEVYLIHAAEWNVMGHKRMTERSVVLTASESGTTPEVLEACKKMKEMGIRVFAMTDPEGPIGKVLMSIRLSPIPPTQSRRSRQRIPAVSADVRRRFRRPGPARGPSCDRTSR